MKRQLLLGCGVSREKLFNPQEPWEDLVTLDVEPAHKPDVVWDLNNGLPFRWNIDGLTWVQESIFHENEFDEIHAYDLLEHLGAQGNWGGFFHEFAEYHRILKPNGFFCGIVPAWNSFWAWGDPGHTRVINEGTLSFLSQAHYKCVGSSPSTDYRSIYKADFRLFQYEYRGRKEDPNEKTFYFVLQAVKE